MLQIKFVWKWTRKHNMKQTWNTEATLKENKKWENFQELQKLSIDLQFDIIPA